MIISLQTVSKRTRFAIIAFSFVVMSGLLLLVVGAYRDYITQMGTRGWLGLFMGAVVATIPLHEGLHGLFFRLYGGKVSFGATLKTRFGPVFWATSDKVFTRKQSQHIALAPQILTVICVILTAFHLPVWATVWLGVLGTSNLGGGAFDIYCAAVLNRYPSTIRVRDTKDGMLILEEVPCPPKC